MGGEAVCPDSGQHHGQRSAGIFQQIPQGNAALHLAATDLGTTCTECVVWVWGSLWVGQDQSALLNACSLSGTESQSHRLYSVREGLVLPNAHGWKFHCGFLV